MCNLAKKVTQVIHSTQCSNNAIGAESEANDTDIEFISRQAATQRYPPDDLNVAERCLFYSLRDMYDEYKRGTLNATDGAERKNKALRQYEADCMDIQKANIYTQHVAEMYKRIEWAAKCYHDIHDLYTADKFVEAVYGCELMKRHDLKRGDIGNTKGNESERNGAGAIPNDRKET